MMTVSRLDGGCRAPMDGFTACLQGPPQATRPAQGTIRGQARSYRR